MSTPSSVDQLFLGKTDYVMLGIMLVISMGIGIFFAIAGSKKKTKVEYLLGSRSLGALPVCLSLFATFQSAISMLGIPAEIYSYGTMALYNSVATVLSYLLAIVMVVPLFHPLKITSVNEYLEMRFRSHNLRILGTLVGVLNSFTYMTIALLSPALALQTAVDLPLWLSIVLIGGVGTIYTAIKMVTGKLCCFVQGGIKSVIWTDVFQTIIIFGGIVVILIKGSIDVGGINRVLEIAAENGRVIYDDIRPDPRVRHTVWGLVIGGTIYWLSAHFTQSSVQRIVAIKSEKEARLSFILAVPLVIFFGSIMILTGLVLLAYFFNIGCDPLRAGYLKNRNQLMPYFVMHSLSFLPGLPGLYMATIFSGALSTLSSGINALTANTVEDFLGGLLANRRESTVTAISKILVCFYGAGIITLAYLARELPGPVTQITYSALGATCGPLLGIFILGATFSRANAMGASCGLIIGLIISIWISVGSFMYSALTPPLPHGPIDDCSSQNASMSVVAWNSSLANIIPAAYATVSSTPASVTMSATNRSMTQGITYGEFSVYDISYVWTPVIGLIATVIPGLIASFISGYFQKSKEQPHPRLMFPFIRTLCNMVDVTADKDLEYKSNFILT